MKNDNSCGVAPSENKKSYGGEPSEKKIGVFLHGRKQYCNQIETNKNGFNMVKKGFNMVLKGFIAFGWLKKPRVLMIRAGWPLPKIKIPTGWNLPEKKSAFFIMVAIFFPCIVRPKFWLRGRNLAIRPYYFLRKSNRH